MLILNGNLKPKSTNMRKVWKPTIQDESTYLAFDSLLSESVTSVVCCQQLDAGSDLTDLETVNQVEDGQRRFRAMFFINSS